MTFFRRRRPALRPVDWSQVPQPEVRYIPDVDPVDLAWTASDFGNVSDPDGWLHLLAPADAYRPYRWRVVVVDYDGQRQDVTDTGCRVVSVLFWPGLAPDGVWCWLIDSTLDPSHVEVHIPGRDEPLVILHRRRRVR